MINKYQLLEDVFMVDGIADDSIIRERLDDSSVMSILIDGDDYYIAFYNSAELYEQFGGRLPDKYHDRAIIFINIVHALDMLKRAEELHEALKNPQ